MNVICPKCLDKDAIVSVDLDDGETVRCGGCEEEYTLTDVREMVAGWGPLLTWLDAHPAKRTAAAV